jgi:hypothetical protein
MEAYEKGNAMSRDIGSNQRQRMNRTQWWLAAE